MPTADLRDLAAKLDHIAASIARARLGDPQFDLDGPLGDAIAAAVDHVRHQLDAYDRAATDDQRSR